MNTSRLFRWLMLASALGGCDAADLAPSAASEPRAEASSALTSQLAGFADLHLHMMAEEAFGGGWLHGKHDGADALADCDGGGEDAVVLHGDHARVRSNLSDLLNKCPANPLVKFPAGTLLDSLLVVGGAAGSEAIGSTEGTKGDTGLHLARKRYGDGWPRWDTIAHQQSWGEDLRAAHARGLNVTVMSAVSYEWLCNLLPAQNRKRACDEMSDVRIQLGMARAFAQNNASWLEIALSPADVRRIVGQGKLAMILAVEASHLFGRDVNAQNLGTRLDELYDLGVRSLQLVHQQDNPLAGAALHHPMFQFAQYTENCRIDTDCGATFGGVTLGFDVDANCKNVQGLTTLGATLIQELMKRGMLIDGAHLSERSLDGVFALTEAAQYYPVYISHGHLREIMTSHVANAEKSTPAAVIKRIRQSGGMFGLRTAHDETHKYAGSSVPNSCHGSSTSFTQAYEYGSKGLKVPLAFGSDLNGFIQQTRPRFGDLGACSAGSHGEAACEERDQRKGGAPRLHSDFDEKGLAHVGLLPDLMQDLRNMKVDTSNLESSAERFVSMWERARAVRSGMFDAASDLDTSGIIVDRPADVRAQDYPQKCGKTYCPGSLGLGYDCDFNDECESNQCTAVACGVTGGRCVCDQDHDCPGGQWCDRNAPLVGGDNRCRDGKSDGEGCDRDAKCASGHCAGIANGIGWCFTPGSKSIGQDCHANAECTTNRCIDATFKCGCTEHNQCASWQFCGTLANSGKCMDKRGRRSPCLHDFECQSNRCSFGLCTKP